MSIALAGLSVLLTPTSHADVLHGSQVWGDSTDNSYYNISNRTAQPVTVRAIKVNGQDYAASTIFYCYFKTNSFVGSENTPGNWVLVGAAQLDFDLNTHDKLLYVTNMVLAPNQQHAFLLTDSVADENGIMLGVDQSEALGGFTNNTLYIEGVDISTPSPSGNHYTDTGGADNFDGLALYSATCFPFSIYSYVGNTPPVLLMQPESQTVGALSPVSFAVVPYSPDNTTYQWRRNGVNIPGATNSTYVLPATMDETGAQFSVLATSSQLGAAVSSSAILTVTNNPAGDTNTIIYQQTFTPYPSYDMQFAAISSANNNYYGDANAGNNGFRSYLGKMIAGGDLPQDTTCRIAGYIDLAGIPSSATINFVQFQIAERGTFGNVGATFAIHALTNGVATFDEYVVGWTNGWINPGGDYSPAPLGIVFATSGGPSGFQEIQFTNNGGFVSAVQAALQSPSKRFGFLIKQVDESILNTVIRLDGDERGAPESPDSLLKPKFTIAFTAPGANAYHPKLNITSSGNNVVVSYDNTVDPNFVLQSSPSLSPATWTDVSTNVSPSTISAGAAAQFFRLRKY